MRVTSISKIFVQSITLQFRIKNVQCIRHSKANYASHFYSPKTMVIQSDFVRKFSSNLSFNDHEAYGHRRRIILSNNESWITLLMHEWRKL